MGWTTQQKKWAAMRRGERSFFWPHLNPNHTPSEEDMIKQSEIDAIQKAMIFTCKTKGMHPDGGMCGFVISSDKSCGVSPLQACKNKVKKLDAEKEKWTPVDHLVKAAKLLTRHAKHANNCPFNLKISRFECTCGLNDALATVDEWQL